MPPSTITPPRLLPWPPINFVAEWTTTSTPCSIGLIRKGVCYKVVRAYVEVVGGNNVVAILDAEKLNKGFLVFCNVKLKRMNKEIALDFTRRIMDIPKVTECYNISGRFDYLLKIQSPDMKYYQEFILNVLGTIESLGSIESTFVMDEIKNNWGVTI